MAKTRTRYHAYEDYDHQHGPDCGHTAVRHEGHTDYLYDGHLQQKHEAHVHDHRVAVSALNPDACTSGHACGAHETAHRHVYGCDHEAVRHGDHIDHLVAGHLHHRHEGHCDDHGELQIA